MFFNTRKVPCLLMGAEWVCLALLQSFFNLTGTRLELKRVWEKWCRVRR